jgi:pimeloyl-ACP methyl ester carboxylesterase
MAPGKGDQPLSQASQQRFEEVILMPEATLHDGSTVEIEIHGEGPAVLLPVNPRPVEGPQAEELRKYGADPALGYNLINGLSDAFRVVAFHYEGNVLGIPKPDTLTPENVVSDLLAVAGAAGVDRFAYYGYSWLGMVGLQLAARTDRLWALAVGGYPPLDGPYAEMLRITTAAHEMSGGQGPEASEDEWSTAGLSKDSTKQFVTLYRALQDFDDRAAQAQITCPRLCIVGSADEMDYGKAWGNLHVSISGPVIRHRAELEALGWDVVVLDGLDHMQAMQAAQVVPVLRPWLASSVAAL